MSDGTTVALSQMSRTRFRDAVEALRSEFRNAEVISRRGNRIVVRCRAPGSGASVVAKMWSRPDVKGRLRRLLGVAPSDLEARTMARLRGACMPIPRVLGFGSAVPPIEGFTDVIFMEDLGPCEPADEVLKSAIRSGCEAYARDIEDQLIRMTEVLLNAGFIDSDHGLLNIVVRATGDLVRLDFELARYVIWPRCFPTWYGNMLGRVIGLHAFAVQPDVGRTTDFARRLCQHLRPPQRALIRASVHARAMMARQYEEIGLDTRLDLPWEKRS